MEGWVPQLVVRYGMEEARGRRCVRHKRRARSSLALAPVRLSCPGIHHGTAHSRSHNLCTASYFKVRLTAGVMRKGGLQQCRRARSGRRARAMWPAERGLPAPGTGWGQWRQGARRETVQAASSARTRVKDRARPKGAQHWYAGALLTTSYTSHQRQSTSKVTSRLHWKHFIPFWWMWIHIFIIAI